MSVINSSQMENSQQFQLLKPQQDSDSLNFISLDNYKPIPSTDTDFYEEMTMGIIIDEDTFIVLDKKQSHQIITQEQWMQFIGNKKKEVELQILSEKQGKNQQIHRLSQRFRIKIIKLQSNDYTKRKQFFQISNYNHQIESQYINKQKQQQQNKQQIITILSYQLTNNELSNLKKNAIKINKVLRQLTENRSGNVDASRIHAHQKDIMQWIYDMLMRYAIDDQQIRYCKGLEYICLGIVVMYPQFNLAKYTQLFYHFLKINKFRELYLEGSPKFFIELHKIKDYLKDNNPQLYNKIQQNQGDFKNLFITYYRSCLIYKVYNTEVIRKIFQLLFIQGISVIKTILLRILSIEQQKFMGKNKFLESVSSQIILQYFQQPYQQTVSQRLYNVFII